MKNILIQILMSGIFIVFTLIQSKITFKKNKPRPIQEDEKRWEGGKREFIEFKKYEYDRQFWYITLIFSFNAVLFGIFSALYNIIINVIGFSPGLF